LIIFLVHIHKRQQMTRRRFPRKVFDRNRTKMVLETLKRKAEEEGEGVWQKLNFRRKRMEIKEKKGMEKQRRKRNTGEEQIV
jgi:hypothetical protein